MPPGVFIVILNYKNWQDVVECLGSVFRSDYENFKVIVIDNDSQNNSLENLMQWVDNSSVLQGVGQYKYFHSRDLKEDTDPLTFPKLVFIQNEKNNGFAGGNNIALRHLRAQDTYIWLLNPDMTIQKDTLSSLVNFSGSLPARTITGAVIKFHDQPDKVHLYGGGRIKFNSATTVEIGKVSDIPRLDYISGGSLFTHAGSFAEIGLLPEDYFLYWEETDWCYQAALKGYRQNVCLNAICYDKISTTIGKGYLADYYYMRNGLLFVDKYKKKKIPLVFFWGFIRLLKRMLSGQPGKARGIYKGMMAYLKMTKNEN